MNLVRPLGRLGSEANRTRAVGSPFSIGGENT